MTFEEAKELHSLLYSFSGMFHEKFTLRFRRQYPGFLDLKKNHIKILNMLYQHDLLTQTEIGKKLDIEKGSLTSLIDHLEQKGLVKRCEDPEDRRKYLLTLSEQGREEMHKLMDYYSMKFNQFFNEVDPEETRKFIESLHFVVDFMKKV